MSEQLNFHTKDVLEGRDYYREMHKDAAEAVVTSENELKEKSKILAEAGIRYRASETEEEHSTTIKEMNDTGPQIKKAAVEHELAHVEYAKSVADAREHYEDNADIYHEQAAYEARADGKQISHI